MMLAPAIGPSNADILPPQLNAVEGWGVPMTPEQRAARNAQQRLAKRAYDNARYEQIADKKRAKAAAWYLANKKWAIGLRLIRYERNKTAAQAEFKARRMAHIAADPTYRDRENEGGRKRYAANPEHYRALNQRSKQRWLERNPGVQAERLRARYWKDPERARARGVQDAQNRRARQLAAGGQFTADDVKALYEQQKGNCVFCLKPLGKATPHIDHYKPLARGGSNDRSNLRLLHRLCNMKKHAKDPVKFGLEHGLLAW